MRVVIAGGHGRIAMLLARLLVERGDQAVGLVRNPAQVDVLTAIGAIALVVDLERATVDEVAAALDGADAVVFAAGAGAGSGAARKETVDRAAAVLVAEAAERAGVRRHVQISAMGLDRAGDATVDEVFRAYLAAKEAAERDLRGRDLDWTIVRPGRLTDGPATGRVNLADSVPPGAVSRADVAAVLASVLDDAGTAGRILELTSVDG
ncbi:MAG: NAD(P)-binding oxidoreductase [Labedaea sp.]